MGPAFGTYLAAFRFFDAMRACGLGADFHYTNPTRASNVRNGNSKKSFFWFELLMLRLCISSLIQPLR